MSEHTVTCLSGPAPRDKGPGWGPLSASTAAAAVTTAPQQAGGSSLAPTALLQAVAELRAPTVPALLAKERQSGSHTLGSRWALLIPRMARATASTVLPLTWVTING